MTTMPAVISATNPKPEETLEPKTPPIKDDWSKVPGRWLGTRGPLPKPMSNECLQALRDAAAARGGRQLPDAERKAIVERFK